MNENLKNLAFLRRIKVKNRLIKIKSREIKKENLKQLAMALTILDDKN